MSYGKDDYAVDLQKVAELMAKMEPCIQGYARMIVVLACTRMIAAMFGPVEQKGRDEYLQGFPSYMHELWQELDKILQ